MLGLPVSVPAVTESSALGAALCAGKGAGLYTSLTELEGELRKRVATFEPDQAAVAAYADSYAGWQRIYRRMLDLSEDGLLNPLWRAAGAGPPGPAAVARHELDRRAISSGQLKEAPWQTATAAPKAAGFFRSRAPVRRAVPAEGIGARHEPAGGQEPPSGTGCR